MTPEVDSAEVFGEYASFYDALYADKDYEAEVAFLVEAFNRHAEEPVKTILDLGCGTGSHDLPLTRRGFSVVGVDRAAEMIALAKQKAAAENLDAEFLVGDAVTLDLGRTFDAVISMFAVVCYQCSNEDLLGIMKTARRHLEPGGLFVFDGWFGPGVLSDRPVETSKTVETPDGQTIERHATPDIDVLAHTVQVTYKVTRSSGGRVLEETTEAHKVRFLFPQEMKLLLELAGFEIVALGPFLDLDAEVTGDTWNFSLVARAV